jgi:hypothetical protein
VPGTTCVHCSLQEEDSRSLLMIVPITNVLFRVCSVSMRLTEPSDTWKNWQFLYKFSNKREAKILKTDFVF